MKKSPPRQYSRLLRTGLGIVIGVISLYLAFRDVDVKEVGQALSQANKLMISLALISVGVNTLSKVFRWEVMLRPAGYMLKFSLVLASFLAGQMLNALLPIRAGELSRIYTIGRSGPGGAYVLGTIVLEKTLDTVCYGLLFLALLFLIPLPNWISDSGLMLVGIAVFILFAVFFIAYRRDWLMVRLQRILKRFPEHVQEYIVRHTNTGLNSLNILQRPAELARLAAWSAVIWGTAVLTNQLVMLSFGIHLPWTASLLILIGLQAGISIPSLPGRVGIFEYICVLAILFFGIERSIALSYGILLHALVYLPIIFSGLLSFWFLGLNRRGEKKEEMTRLE